MRARRLVLVLVAALSASACGAGAGGGSSGPEGGLPPAPFATLGELADAIHAASTSSDPAVSLDTDGDSIPDVVEERLGSDSARRDSDGDGLVDGFELFGDSYDPRDRLPDGDRDGLAAEIDDDDDGDRANDGLNVDTDGDGVANYLEFYGYTFDLLTGTFRPWNGDDAVPHFFTDPLQPSTDQDAYPDGMEVSGALLDPTVRTPGDDPLVPAVPDVVFELRGYSVTLNEDVQVTDSRTLSKGREWGRETQTTHEFTNESTWEEGGEIGFSAKSDSYGLEGKYSASHGGTTGHTFSTATTVSTNESVLDEAGWSQARSSNPTDAAHLKLLLKVVNRGTAPISNVVPTLTLQIGGLDVRTFEPGGASIAMLVPGDTYPHEPAVHWVVDGLASGEPLSVTMSELRALERGAPVSIVLTQVRGDVMRLAPGGVWESVGDANQYLARCDAVCASLKVQLEDGTSVRQMVYADDTPSSPRMTLGQALAHLNVDEDGTFVHWDENGTPHERSMEGFSLVVDPETLRANGWVLALDGADETTAPEGTTASDLRLLPASSVLLRAPRDPLEPPGPEMYYAYFDALTGEVKACVADYRGIASVKVLDETDALVLELEEDLPGAGFFSGLFDDDDGFGSRVLRVVVTNLDGATEEREIGRLYQPSAPVKPLINSVSLDRNTERLYANVESGNPDAENSAIAWIRAFHPKMPDGFVDLGRVVNYFEDQNGYEVVLPFTLVAGDEPVRVVAYVSAPDVWTEDVVEPHEITSVPVFDAATLTLYAYTQRNPWLLNDYWVTKTVNFDKKPLAVGDVRQTSGPTPDPPIAPVDLWVRVDGAVYNKDARMGFNMDYARMPGADYSALTKLEVVDAAPNVRSDLVIGRAGGLNLGDVLAFRTANGRYGKLTVTSIDYYYNTLHFSRECTIKFKALVWE